MMENKSPEREGCAEQMRVEALAVGQGALAGAGLAVLMAVLLAWSGIGPEELIRLAAPEQIPVAQAEPYPYEVVQAQVRPEHRAPELFLDAQHLSGWRLVGGGRLTLSQGLLLLSHDAERRTGYLVSEVTGRDFEAHVLWRVVQGHCGFCYRAGYDRRSPDELCGPQVRWSSDPCGYTGGIFERHGRGWLGLLHAPVSKPRLWHELRIVAHRETVEVHVDGRLAGRYAEPLAEVWRKPGHFAVHIQGGTYLRVWIHHIAIRISE